MKKIESNIEFETRPAWNEFITLLCFGLLMFLIVVFSESFDLKLLVIYFVLSLATVIGIYVVLSILVRQKIVVNKESIEFKYAFFIPRLKYKMETSNLESIFFTRGRFNSIKIKTKSNKKKTLYFGYIKADDVSTVIYMLRDKGIKAESTSY